MHGGAEEELWECKKSFKLYLFVILDEPGSFDTIFHVEADVHFDVSDGVSQFDDGNLEHTEYESR